MINEKIAKYIEGQIKKRASEGEGTEDEIRAVEIMRRKNTVRELERQKQKENDEIEYLEGRKVEG